MPYQVKCFHYFALRGCILFSRYNGVTKAENLYSHTLLKNLEWGGSQCTHVLRGCISLILSGRNGELYGQCWNSGGMQEDRSQIILGQKVV